jgi:hypothetical protein
MIPLSADRALRVIETRFADEEPVLVVESLERRPVTDSASARR